MKLEFQNRLPRVLIEFLPVAPAIRRYRTASARLDAEIGRLLQRQAARKLRRSASEEAA